jgi:alkyl hydroperoxide reductase subunit AhpF
MSVLNAKLRSGMINGILYDPEMAKDRKIICLM